MKRTLKAELLNLPNMLTLGRVAAIPFVMLLIWRGEAIHCVMAAWVYAAATLTDFFDGWLARRWGLVTVMGKFLDPLADKLLVMAMLFMLVYLHRLPAWIAVVILSREMVINGLRSIASSEGLVIPAGRGGKIKTALQMLGVLCLLLHYTYPVYFYGLWRVEVDFAFVGLWILMLSVIFSLTSAVEYFRLFFHALDARERAA
ncbi:CDP-diacylglycerol--glycerol-3-phosphate 3-phosphatidyltransferase [Myxococcota bacterium]|nr:CDP-diacylglycerol--glycerol-3-phosphate 3-phosphatidyltransferase [Myxococcota bacterium]MBU1431073.1 CDP-diacylglycerol--glycerol-3-phosphate 3-phosphatidyltransferase [Myxococcota bacterium]MBU1896517.1 CDP-diacylglycerol--glycerol-3-phosphate 3-phosphatidyltransferase [Myxococcota bacterium]